jgi:multimeric flavodoxin WrbA
MKRRDFIASTGAGLVTILLGSCRFTSKEELQQPSAQLAAADSNNGGSKKMQIAVITGSPHKNGTSALLTDKFIEGAKTAGHEFFRFNAAFEDIHPCLGCDRCGMNGPCVHQDDIDKKLMPKLLAADLVAFVTPLYYYGMSAQIKIAVDRFYARNSKLHGNKKAVLMATAYNSSDWTFNALTEHYKTLVRYMEWENRGMVLAVGCGGRSDIERSEFPNQAYQLGLNI